MVNENEIKVEVQDVLHPKTRLGKYTDIYAVSEIVGDKYIIAPVGRAGKREELYLGELLLHFHIIY